MRKFIFICLIVLLHLSTSATGQESVREAPLLKIGTYYFPGWKAGQVGAPSPDPWSRIMKYPEREPLLGWYAEDDPGVIEQQLKWMRDYGLNFVVFSWYWSREGKPVLAHALNAFLSAQNRHGMDFAIMWANHTDYNFSREKFSAMFDFWANRYFFRNDYLKIDGKPIVFLFSAQVFNRNARAIGLSTADLTQMIDKAARAAGLPGALVIGGVGGNAGRNFDYTEASGYAGFSAYNFHGPATLRFEGGRYMSHSYAELDMAYRDHWDWMLKHATGLYVLPMSSGWDKRPWGGSSDPKHDNSMSTPQEFAAHLRAARQTIETHRSRTRGLGVICCWNEFGEGSFIEPTKQGGFSYLEQVRTVFGERRP